MSFSSNPPIRPYQNRVQIFQPLNVLLALRPRKKPESVAVLFEKKQEYFALGRSGGKFLSGQGRVQKLAVTGHVALLRRIQIPKSKTEERRVGKEGRSRGSPDHSKKKAASC